MKREIAKYLEQPEQIPIQLRYAEIERRIYDLELIIQKSFDYNQSATKTRENDLKNKQLKKKSKN